MEESGSMIPGKARLLAHAQDYRDRAKALLTTRPSWITDGIEVRTKEYEELAEYFVKLANRDEVRENVIEPNITSTVAVFPAGTPISMIFGAIDATQLTEES